jgi:putative endonuclease
MSRAVGAFGEGLAADFLQTHNLRIVQRNYTCPGGEIDLICTDGETLVFVEVRLRADDEHGDPLETISVEKRRRLVRAARRYLAEQGIDEDTQACRFDVVGVVGSEVVYLKNAFRTDGAD